MILNTRTMDCKVFTNYRRADSEEAVNWLYEKLSKKFNPGEIFMDSGSIETGEYWNQKIKTKLEEAAIVLVMIGQEWLDAGVEKGGKRLG